MKNINLIYGLDKELINREIKEIIKKIDINKDSIIKYSLEEDNINLILEDASTINLFGDKKLIIIEESSIFNSNTIDTTELEKYLNNYNESTYLIFTLLSDKIDTKKTIYQLINDKGNIINLNDKNINNYDYVDKYIKNNNYQISSIDIRYFLSKVGNDNSNIINELEKLFLFKIEDKIINKEAIDKIVIPNIEESLFPLVDAITNKDKNKTIKLYQEFLNNNEEPIILISLLASKYRLIYQVKRLSEEKLTDDQMAKKLDSRPYPIKLARNLSYNYTEKELLNILKELANLDKDIKLGNVNPIIGLELFILAR